MRRFVEIIASFALALDISTLASVASGHFASAHERLGRNRPEHGLREKHLNKEFFTKVVGSRGTLVDWKPFKVGNNLFATRVYTCMFVSVYGWVCLSVCL